MAILKKILILIILPLSAFAKKQGQARLDSLLQALPAMKEDDSNKVKALLDIGFEYRSINPDKGIEYGLKGRELTEQIDWKKGIGKSYNTLGTNYKAKSDYPKALESYFKALKILEELGLRKEAGTVMMNIGTVYRPLKEYEKALEYYQRALLISRETRSRKVEAQLDGNIGVVFYEQQQFDSATVYNQKALSIFREIDDKTNTAWILANMGDAFAEQGNLEKGIAYHQQAIEINEALNNKAYIAGSLENIGRMYINRGRAQGNSQAIRQGIDYYHQARAIYEELGDLDYLKDIHLMISEAEQTVGNSAAALRHFKQYTTLKDSVFSFDAKAEIAKLETERAIALKEVEKEIQTLKKRNERNFLLSGIGALLLITGFVWNGYQKQRRSNVLLSEEKRKSDELLLNILPGEVADELKKNGRIEAKQFEDVTVLFTDFVDFTRVSEKLSAQELVSELHHCFKAFDEISARHGIEKIKTIGDAYHAVGGLPNADPDHAEKAVRAALEIRAFMNERNKESGRRSFQLRIGIHSGSVVAGIVGVRKFTYDIWGDTVNTAARLEQTSEAGKINISETTYQLIKDRFNCSYRGEISAKNKGELKMYFVE